MTKSLLTWWDRTQPRGLPRHPNCRRRGDGALARGSAGNVSPAARGVGDRVPAVDAGGADSEGSFDACASVAGSAVGAGAPAAGRWGG